MPFKKFRVLGIIQETFLVRFKKSIWILFGEVFSQATIFSGGELLLVFGRVYTKISPLQPKQTPLGDRTQESFFRDPLSQHTP